MERLPLAREARLELGPLDADTFLRLARRAAFAEEAGGWVGSQYEAELLAGAPQVGTLALVGCDNIFGAMSFGIHDLPRGGKSGRIDLVITVPEQRGRGISALLMSQFIVDLERRLGDELVHMSVIAQHPAIGHIVRKWGFVAVQAGTAPLHQVELGDADRGPFFARVRADARDRLASLKHACLRCRKHAWVEPWCKGEGDVAA